MRNAILKLVLPVATILLFIMASACNQSGNNQDQTQTERHDHVQTEQHEENHDHNHDGAVSGQLILNNGAKWQADDPTNKNAANLISIGEQFSKKSNRSLEDYHAFGNDIHSGINKMIRECTMEGAADQALHFWFLPLLEQTSTLKEATDTTGLSSTTSEMVNRLEIYNDFFE